nr:MAG TPA: hypothetical protein [Caudoviricetes sp.]
MWWSDGGGLFLMQKKREQPFSYPLSRKARCANTINVGATKIGNICYVCKYYSSPMPASSVSLSSIVRFSMLPDTSRATLCTFGST